MWPVSLIGENNINILKQPVISQKKLYPSCFVSTQPLRRGYFQAAIRASSAKK